MNKLPIPAAALTKHIGFLGINGSGKTSVCKSAVVEPALEAGERVLAIDPTGVWWGLRIAANGKGKGYPIYIFGGEHGDYPLRKNNAAELAEAFGTSSDSAIFDTSQMTVTERTLFFTEFAETLLRKNKGPVKLIIDEAHLFMPQSGARGGGLAPDMLHAGNNLVSLGRSKGLRISLISQRPAKLHKDSLTQVHSLVAMRLIAPQDRAAVKEWIGDQAFEAEGDKIVASLPSLAPGEAWVWAPAEGSLERVKFPRPRTFDSSAAPDEGDGSGPTLTPINLDILKTKLANIDAEKKANDPAALRHEIGNLKQKIAALSECTEPDPRKMQQIGEAGFDRGRNHMRVIIGETNAVLANAIADIAAAVERCKTVEHAFQQIADPPAGTPPPAASQWTPEELKKLAQPGRHPLEILHAVPGLELNSRRETSRGETMPAGERTCLIAIAQYPNGLTNSALAVITGYARSTRNLYKQRLRANGFTEEHGERTRATPAGIKALGPFDRLPTGHALQKHTLATLPDGERNVLEFLCGIYPQTATGERIDEKTGYARSTRNLYLQRLRARELIESDRNNHNASKLLFG